MYHESKVGKFIIFKIADFLLSLPINDVLKVVNSPSVVSRGLKTMGLVQLGHHTIRVLDLHQQLNSGGLSKSLDNPPFLVITRNREGELCGISVDQPPDLVELPLESIRSLPKSEPQSNALGIFSHVAVVSQKEVTTTIFLLDMKRVTNTAINNYSPLSLKPS